MIFRDSDYYVVTFHPKINSKYKRLVNLFLESKECLPYANVILKKEILLNKDNHTFCVFLFKVLGHQVYKKVVSFRNIPTYVKEKCIISKVQFQDC